jgi:hypothetical protein
MPFGKYRGRQVNELPFNYLEWLTTIDLLEPLQAYVNQEYAKRCRGKDLIDLTAVDEIVSAGVRTLARLYHPDVGGDHQKMVAINNAADWLRDKVRS